MEERYYYHGKGVIDDGAGGIRPSGFEMEESMVAPVMGNYGDTASEKFSCRKKWDILVPVRIGFY